MTGMQRYSGEHLGSAPHIVVIGSCKVGNFVVSTPVLRGLRARFPDAVIGFIGSEVTADFERALPVLNWRCSWDDPSAGSGLRLQQTLVNSANAMAPCNWRSTSMVSTRSPAAWCPGWSRCMWRVAASAPIDAAISLGASIRVSAFWRIPIGTVLLSSSAMPMCSAAITSLNCFCQLAWVQDHVDPTAVELPSADPPFAVPDVLIHCTTARAAKVWPFSHWRQVLDVADAHGWSVGLVGSQPAAQKEAYNAGEGEDSLLRSTGLIDLRGQTSLMQLAGACRQAKAVISVDAGPLHIAAAVGTPTYAIVGNDCEGTGASPVRLWMPRCSNVTRSVSPASCSACADNRFRNDACLVDGHPCMAAIQPLEVIEWLKRQFN